MVREPLNLARSRCPTFPPPINSVTTAYLGPGIRSFVKYPAPIAPGGAWASNFTYASESISGISALKFEFPLNHAFATEVKIYTQGRVIYFVDRSLTGIHRPAAYV